MRSMVEGFCWHKEGPSTAFGGPPPLQMQGRIKQSRHFHFASGGRLIRIASILPPVFRPNNVPRS